MKHIGIKKFCFSFLLLGFSICLYAQNFEYVADIFTKDHGLPDNYIKDLDIDSKGNIWVLTRKGIVMFDGFTFETITIESDYAFREFEIDIHDNLWISLMINVKNITIEDKIIIYKPELNKAIKINEYCRIKDLNIRVPISLWKDSDNNILLSHKQSVAFRYNGTELIKVTELSEGLYLNTRNKHPNLISFYTPSKDKIVFTDIRTKQTKIIKDKDINFYIWHNDKILFKSHFIKQNKSAANEDIGPRINLVATNNDTLLTNFTKYLKYEFHKDDFYFITNNNLYVYNLKNRKVINISEQLSPSLPKLELLNIRVFNNIIWLATNNGIIKVEKQKNIFHSLLNDDIISTREMLSISDDSLLVCTEKGIFLVDISKNRILQRTDKESVFYGISEIAHNRFLLGQFGYINKVLDIESFTTSPFAFNVFIDPETQKMPDVFLNSYLDKNGKLWITSNKGIGIFDLENNELEYMFQDEISKVSTTDIISGPHENTIFLLTNNGIFLVDIDLLEIEKVEGFENQLISHIAQDTDIDSIFWVASRYQGLIKYKLGYGILENIKVENGLGNNSVHSVFEDNHGRLWLSTDYGISVYNKSTKEISVIIEENGIHENEMNRHSYCFVNDSLIVYGGINGIIKFNPYDVRLEDNNKELDVKFLKFIDRSSNKSKVEPLDKNKKRIYLRRNQINPKLIFNIPQNSFSNTLRYIISNINDEWIYTQRNTLDLSNFAEGNTNLFVSKKIGINEWSSPKTINIYKAPPIYRSYWFYVVLLSLFSLGIFLYVNNKRVRALKMNKRIRQEVEIKTKELFYKNKSLSESKTLNDQLFAIIGHDLRSPLISLNNISKSLNYLTENNQFDDVKKLTNTVESNSKKSLAIIDRLIEWTERQKESMLEFHEVKISESIDKSIYEHEEFANKKGVKVNVIGDKWISCISNEASILIVLGNLISNAIKFSFDEGVITIKFYKTSSEVIIEIKDQGSGMNKEQLNKINNFEPVDAMKSPDGEIGLGMGVLMSADIAKKIKGKIHFKSEFGNGTTSYLTLPN